jgi:uncharacterized membrane protein YbhN (UPF0104 family)
MRGWKPLITIGVLSLAGFLLLRTLSRYSLDELVAAVAAVPASRLFAAGGFALASYVCLTGFDYLALHYVGRPLPYFKVALASFTSLSLGHNIGLAALSSGAIRYRFYTRWGLSPVQVAKMILFCGVTVGLGLMGLGGAALLLRTELAEEITGLAKPVTIGLGIGCLAAPLLYFILAAVIRRPLVIRHWSLDMPPPWIAVGQIAVGTLPLSPPVSIRRWQRSLTLPISAWLRFTSLPMQRRLSAMFRVVWASSRVLSCTFCHRGI